MIVPTTSTPSQFEDIGSPAQGPSQQSLQLAYGVMAGQGRFAQSDEDAAPASHHKPRPKAP